MKRLILISLFILINARILQQIYFRANIESVGVVGNEWKSGVSDEDNGENKVSSNTRLAWDGVAPSYSDANKPSTDEFNHLNTSSHVSLSDSRFFTNNRLMKESKSVSNSLVDSIDVWKGVLGGLRQSLRGGISTAFNSVYYSSVSEVVIGLLLGKEGLERGSSYHLFKITGTQHLLAVSGFHLSLFIMFVSKFYKSMLSKHLFIFVNIIVAGFFLYLVGFSPGLFRAFLMFSISSFALYFNRQKHTLISFFITFLIAILVDIQALTSISFQLSYSATMGIILFSKIFRQIKNISGLFLGDFPQVMTGISSYFIGSFLISIVAQISVFPLVAYHFHELNLFSVVTSSLISWMIPVVMQMSLLLAIFYFIVPFNLFLIISFPLLFFVTAMIEILKIVSFDWSIMQFPMFSIGVILRYYMVIIAVYSQIHLVKYVKKKKKHAEIYNFNF